MKIVLTNETIVAGKISFDAELVPLNEHEHGLIVSALKDRPIVFVTPIDEQQHADVIALHFELAPKPQSNDEALDEALEDPEPGVAPKS